MRTLTRIVALQSDERGTSAIEFSLFVGLLSFGLINLTDVSIYLYTRMEVENATEMGAQAAWKSCDPAKGYVPATTNCPGLTSTVTTAVQSTSLGTSVSLQSGSPAEGYYCLNGSGSLQYVSDVSSKPADCTAAGTPNLQPGDYVTVTTTYTYAPLFPGVSVAANFASPISKTAMMRLN